MIFELHSKALYSNWCLYAPDDILFDCGEGCASYLMDRLFKVKSIFITHHHGDHVLGLPSFIGCHNVVAGDNEKPLTVYAPWSDSFDKLVEYTLMRNPNRKFDLKFVIVKPGDKIPLDSGRYVQVFKANHSFDSVGYSVCETRKRLSIEALPYKDSIPEALKSGVITKDTLYTPYVGNNFTYLLDNCGIDESAVPGNPDILIQDASFLDPKDRERASHNSFDEAYNIAKSLKAKKTYYAHISSRYGYKDIEKVQTQLDKAKDLMVFSCRATL